MSPNSGPPPLAADRRGLARRSAPRSLATSIVFAASSASRRGRACSSLSVARPSIAWPASTRWSGSARSLSSPQRRVARSSSGKGSAAAASPSGARAAAVGDLGRHVGRDGAGARPGAERAGRGQRRALGGELQVERPVLLAGQEEGAAADQSFDLPVLRTEGEGHDDPVALAFGRRSSDSIARVCAFALLPGR